MKTTSLGLIASLLSWPATAQDLNLDGAWICQSACICGMHPGDGSPTSIAKDKDSFLFTSECGTIGRGHLVGEYSLRIDDWNTTVVVSADQKKIKFDSGTIWKR